MTQVHYSGPGPAYFDKLCLDFRLTDTITVDDAQATAAVAEWPDLLAIVV